MGFNCRRQGTVTGFKKVRVRDGLLFREINIAKVFGIRVSNESPGYDPCQNAVRPSMKINFMSCVKLNNAPNLPIFNMILRGKYGARIILDMNHDRLQLLVTLQLAADRMLMRHEPY